MKRTIAIVLAAALMTVAVPVVAHEANYSSECENRTGSEECPGDRGRQPAHTQCTGPRDAMSSSNSDSLVRRSLGLAGAGNLSVTAYIHITDEDSQAPQPGLSTPGILWLETNGFSGLQDTDWKCKSPDHEDPSEWESHADKVLI